MKKINIKINNKKIACQEGQSILDVAKENDIFIPSLCHHPDFCAKGNCRVCMVEIKNSQRLKTACSTRALEGMNISTKSVRAEKARNINIELIFAEHIEKCATCVWRYKCPLLKMAERYKLEIRKFTDRKGRRKVYKFDNAVELDSTQCIDCRNCIDACSAIQKIDYLEIKNKGALQKIVPSSDKKKKCILCGQCALHCPVSAAQEQYQWQEVEKEINNLKKIVVAQFAPSIRASIGEDFDMAHGKVVTGQMVSALKKLGFDYVFDVNYGADITTITEAEELVSRIKNGGKLPMFTSCCPAWVKYVESYRPDLIPYLTTARSPHMHIGGAIKTYWAERMKINPKNITVVSIMPCTAKKYEATRPEMKIKEESPVDYVLTTREFSFMLKKNNIDLADMKEGAVDSPLGEHSGAGAIYGASGGVMELALRTADFILSKSSKNKISKSKIEFKEARGLKGVKEAQINLAGHNLEIAIVNGIGNIKEILDDFKKYDYVEVMSCPGGCIGGGGQPIPTTNKIRQARMKALYKIDKNKKIRKAHENKSVLDFLSWLKKQKKKPNILHTKYFNKK